MNKILLPFVILVLYSCTPKYTYLKNGDFLFVQAKEENLSGAISRVTKEENKTSYDHIALVERDGKKVYLLHAVPEKGSVKEGLKPFLKNYNNRIIDIFRLKSKFENSINPAITKANTMLDKPYNTAYILDENSFYCSDFIERSFRKDKIFQLNAMTFINPNTGKTDEFWQSFYDKLEVKVPEGKPGCNPNGLSQSDKLFKVKTLQH